MRHPSRCLRVVSFPFACRSLAQNRRTFLSETVQSLRSRLPAWRPMRTTLRAAAAAASDRPSCAPPRDSSAVLRGRCSRPILAPPPPSFPPSIVSCSQNQGVVCNPRLPAASAYELPSARLLLPLSTDADRRFAIQSQLFIDSRLSPPSPLPRHTILRKLFLNRCLSWAPSAVSIASIPKG